MNILRKNATGHVIRGENTVLSETEEALYVIQYEHP